MLKSGLLQLILFSSLLSQTNLWDNDSLKYKIGQMIIFGFQGSTAPSQVLDEITTHNVGGVLLYRVHDNIQDLNQTALLIEELQSAALTPLFIATDQEGGNVTNLRLSNGFANSPSAYSVGQENSEVRTREVAAQFSSWFASMGFNTNFAPVVDLRLNPGNVIGDRSYSDDPAIVAQQASWFMDEFHLNHQVTALKHFPGHGSSEGDSHLGFTDVTDTWQSIELEPYEALIDSGIIDMIMTAHVFNEAMDTQYPATLSYSTITELLRGTLGYEGVVISDAMMMGAITSNYGLLEAVTLAINAGVDILLYNWDDDFQGNRLVPLLTEHIEAQVLGENIPRARIEDSFRRIQSLKTRIGTPSGTREPKDRLPRQIALSNFPNPFNPTTTIRFGLPERSAVSLVIYDVRGNLVRHFESSIKPAGWHQKMWDGRNDRGEFVSTGVYFTRVQTEGSSQTLKMLYLK